jgi:hypothetical protein
LIIVVVVVEVLAGGLVAALVVKGLAGRLVDVFIVVRLT